MHGCPACSSFLSSPVSFPDRIFHKCLNCGIIYQELLGQSRIKYNRAYYFDDYKKQYGRTYLDDFESILKSCRSRASVISGLIRLQDVNALDVGCAYGPGILALAELGAHVQGLDLSPEACFYVERTLGYQCPNCSFEVFSSPSEEFSVITMWYVIEHFSNVDTILKKINNMLKTGGVFAFSTPSFSGITGRTNPERFYKLNPDDHYTIWYPKMVDDLLKRYGFRVVHVRNTGHHPERFPGFEQVKVKGFSYYMLKCISKMFQLGDTFEVYTVKK